MSVESAIPMSQQSGDAASIPQAEELDRLLTEIAGLTKQPLGVQEFHAALLDRAVQITAAVGGAVWVRGNDGTLRIDVERLPNEDTYHHRESRERLVERLLDSRQSAVIPPDNGDRNPTGWLLVGCPILAGDGVATAAVEIFQRTDSPTPVREGTRQILEDICELAADFHRRRELTELRDRAEWSDRFGQFTHRIHNSLDLQPTAYAVVNEARTLIGCDRVCLLDYRTGQSKVLSVSGVDEANRRSNAVQSLQQLTDAVLRADEPLWIVDEPPELAPQIARPLHDYLESSPVRMLAVVPLKESGDESQRRGNQPRQHVPTVIVGALVAESFHHQTDPETVAVRIGAVCGQAALALQNAQRYDDRRGLFGPLRRSWRSSNMTKKLGVVATVLFAVVAMLTFIPADFDVPARGELYPEERRQVFAPADGIVHLAELPNPDQPDVNRNDVLATLRNLPLERQHDQVAGELRIVDEQLKAIRNARSNTRRDDEPKDPRQPLTAREQELEQQRLALQRQLEILKAQRTALTVRSPMTGRILTWDVVRRLETRPVVRGDVLMNVARFEGPWELELRLTQRDAGYLLNARRKSREPLTVQFTLLDQPGESHAATVTRISQAVHDDETDQPFVVVTAAIENPGKLKLRPGATVTASIHCGRRSVGYVWFHDLIDTARSWWAL